MESITLISNSTARMAIGWYRVMGDEVLMGDVQFQFEESFSNHCKPLSSIHLRLSPDGCIITAFISTRESKISTARDRREQILGAKNTVCPSLHLPSERRASMVALKLLPFDAHNHIQLGPPPIPPPFASGTPHESIDDGIGSGSIDHESWSPMSSLGEYILEELQGKHLSGMAIMATHPRDFSTILGLEQQIQHQIQNKHKNKHKHKNVIEMSCVGSDGEERVKIVPCLGVHPWFLHELDPENDWALVSSSLDNDQLVPKWTAELEELLQKHPRAPVGEIGLDGFHFQSEGDTQQLTTPMDTQIEAFLLQLKVATRLRRPVSLHCVRAMGRIMDALEEVASENYQRLEAEVGEGVCDRDHDHDDEGELLVLPPRIYFHAFGGKASTLGQLTKTLEKPRRIKLPQNANNTNRKKFLKITPPKVYFGFAPPVNFQSPKTPSVVQAVGLDRLVLETDREDIRSIAPDCQQAVPWLASILGVSEEELVRVTNSNVQDLYYSGDHHSSEESAT